MPDIADGFAPTLSDAIAHPTVEARRADRPRKLLADHLDLVEVGTEWDLTSVDKACRGLRNIKETLEADGAKLDSFNFDRLACSLLHKALKLPPKLAASDGFWRWMAVEHASSVIEARMGSRRAKEGLANTEHYGIGTRDIGKNFLAMLWLRADMLYDADHAENPYHLAERHLHTDFFVSGILRHRYAWCSNLARTLVQFQYRHADSKATFLHSTDRRGIRKLYKRLRHLHSVYAFEFMTEQELLAVLERASDDLLQASS